MQIVTLGLVLREVKVGESDRIITLLTPKLGVITASAKGSLRLKSKLFSACGLFCYSEFTLFQGKTMYMVDDAQVKQVFFGVRESIEGTALAMYLAELTLTLSPTGTEAAALLRLLLNSLYLIGEGKKTPGQIKTVFELRALCEAGYMPALIGCGACGKYEGGPFYFNEAAGTLRCADCAAKEGKAPNLDGAALTALRHIALVEDKKIFSFSIPPESMEALGRAAEHYAAHHLDKPLKTLDFLKTVLL